MRVNRLLADAAATLAVATLFSIDAGGVAQAQNAACARVRSACLAAGFRQGAARAGRGVEFDCIDPILQHRRAPANSVLPLPRVNPAIVAACLNPAAARRASAAQAAAAAHAAAPTTATAPKKVTAAAAHAALPTNAASPTNATAATNAASPTNAAAATNAASPTNAAMLTNAAATSAAAPAPGWPPAIIAALAALAAAVGAVLFLVARRRRPAPRPSSAPAPGPTPPTAASSSSSVSPPTLTPDAPTFVAAGPSPTAQPAATQAPVAAAAVGEAAAAGSPSRTHDVFISYSSEDKTVADAVCAILEQQRIRCWITPRDVLPGEEWAGAIVRAIAGTRVVVLIFSASSNASHQVLREIERAVHGGVMIIPFRIQDTPPSQSLEYFISTPHWLDALTPPLEQHVLRLAESIKSLLAQAPP